jgi:hypothetical protein
MRESETSLPTQSNLELWCYLALLELGWRDEDIALQTPLMGGRQIKGGAVVDIILYKPQPCAISLKGRYWHGNNEEEFLEDARLSAEFPEYVVIWDDEAPTYEAMREVVLQRIGRPG